MLRRLPCHRSSIDLTYRNITTADNQHGSTQSEQHINLNKDRYIAWLRTGCSRLQHVDGSYGPSHPRCVFCPDRQQPKTPEGIRPRL